MHIFVATGVTALLAGGLSYALFGQDSAGGRSGRSVDAQDVSAPAVVSTSKPSQGARFGGSYPADVEIGLEPEAIISAGGSTRLRAKLTIENRQPGALRFAYTVELRDDTGAVL